VDSFGYGLMAIPLEGEKQVKPKSFPMHVSRDFNAEGDLDMYEESDEVTMYGISV